MKTETQNEVADAGMARRSFLRYAGASVAAIGVLSVASCTKGTDNNMDGKYGMPNPTGAGIDIGAKSDFAILNYAYALEQLEAAFYIKVVSSMYTGASTDEI